MTYFDDFKIDSMEDLIQLIEEVGFVPFFENEIEGFSIEEHLAPGHWYDDLGDGFWDAWEWKGPVIRTGKCAYGKFLRGKAMYVSSKWFLDFANYRRDGYDFDARFDDGLASYKDKGVVDYITDAGATLTRDIKDNLNYKKDGNKGFETVITRLQMETYVVPVNYEYSKRKNGDEYGWGNCRYDIAENFWGDKLCRSAYKRSPEESLNRIIKHIKKALPKMDEEKLRLLLKG